VLQGGSRDAVLQVPKVSAVLSCALCVVCAADERMRLCVFDVALDARACLPVGMGLVVVWACVCCVRAETAKRLCACLLSLWLEATRADAVV